MEGGCVVVHVPHLDVHLACDHLEERAESARPCPGLRPPMGPRDPAKPGQAAQASRDTHPLVVADGELHRELGLGLKGREEGVREAEVLRQPPKATSPCGSGKQVCTTDLSLEEQKCQGFGALELALLCDFEQVTGCFWGHSLKGEDAGWVDSTLLIY